MLRKVDELTVSLKLALGIDAHIQEDSPEAVRLAYSMIDDSIKRVVSLLAELGFVVAREDHGQTQTALDKVIETFIDDGTDWRVYESRNAVLLELWPELHDALNHLVSEANDATERTDG